MKIFLALAALAATLVVCGCSGPEKQVDSNKTPPPQYVMVPAQKGGEAADK